MENFFHRRKKVQFLRKEMEAYTNERASFLSPSSLWVWGSHWVWFCRPGVCSIIEEDRHSSMAPWLSAFTFYCCDKTSWPKQRGEKRVYLASSSQLQSILNGSQRRNSRRNPEAGTGAETWSTVYLLGPHWLARLAFSYNSGPPAPKWYCLLGAGPSHINHWWRECPIDSPTCQSDGGSLSVDVPFS